MKQQDKRQRRKSTQGELELRIGEVCGMLLRGCSKDEIMHHSSQIWNVGIRQTAKYIKAARERIALSVQKEIEYDYAKAVRRYEELYKLSMERKDYKTAMSVNKELTSLQGLFKQQVEHSGEVKFICNVPD